MGVEVRMLGYNRRGDRCANGIAGINAVEGVG